ncbi:MAG: Peptidase C14 caspase catalytic subunit p20 [bacterium P3]|nr:MAG: Peptidase C14 caspase catalytic subunit p20 [bacterium P3]KWW41946.1 MAG: Peptidase C14 caspase catalytic subunit p20 [bacterium F083]
MRSISILLFLAAVAAAGTGSAQTPAADAGSRLYGFKNSGGAWQIAPRFQKAYAFSSGVRRYATVKLDNRWGCIDAEGNMVVRNIFTTREEAEAAGSEWQRNDEPGKWVYPARNPADGRWGFVNYYGQWKYRPVYEAANAYIGKEPMCFATVRAEGRWGCIDGKGILIINNIFLTREEAEEAGRQWTAGKLYDIWRMPALHPHTGKWGYVNYLGRWVVEAKYDECRHFGADNKYGYAQVKLDGRWGNIDRNGRVVSECIFASREDAAYALLQLEHKRPVDGWRLPVCHPDSRLWGWVNYRGEWVIAPRYEEVSQFANDTGRFATAKLDGLWASIDDQGNLLSKNVFTLSTEAWTAGREWDTGQEPGHWLYPICDPESKHWGYVDYEGKWVIRPVFEGAKLFIYTWNNRVAPAKLSGRWGCIDHTGRFVVTNQYNTSSEAQVAGRQWAEKQKF